MSALDALTRDQLIAALTLMGWEPQLTLIVNRSVGVILTRGGSVATKANPRDAVPAVDGWHNFNDEHLKLFLQRITTEPL